MQPETLWESWEEHLRTSWVGSEILKRHNHVKHVDFLPLTDVRSWAMPPQLPETQGLRSQRLLGSAGEAGAAWAPYAASCWDMGARPPLRRQQDWPRVGLGLKGV